MKLFKKKDKNIEAEETLAKNAEYRKQKKMSLRQLFVPSVARLCSNQL